jgi:hypothetical protein
MGWMILSFIIALLVLYKLSSILGFYDENEDSNKKPQMKDINDIFNINDINSDQENEIIKTKNLEIENNIFRLLNSESQTNVQKIYELDKTFTLDFIQKHLDFLFTILLKELYNGKFENLFQYSNESFFQQISDLIKEKKFNRALVKIDSIEILEIKLDENSNATISAKVMSEQMEKIDQSFQSKIFENNLIIGKVLQKDDAEWIILECKNLIN